MAETVLVAFDGMIRSIGHISIFLQSSVDQNNSMAIPRKDVSYVHYADGKETTRLMTRKIIGLEITRQAANKYNLEVMEFNDEETI